VIPRYAREKLKSGMVHIGLGNFHRAHQAAYLDELLGQGLTEYGISEINILPGSFPIGEILAAQDWLYTLVTKSSGGEEKARVAGPIRDYLDAWQSPEAGTAALEKLACRETVFITLTVTEKGYYYDPRTGDINPAETPVRHDLEHPERPETAAGYIAAALAWRFRTNREALTIMSCDNIPSNGKLLKACVLSLCRESFPEIIPWVEDQVSFPCSMVDRITPGTAAETIKETEERWGIADRWPVFAEDFRQWVLEEDFKSPPPPYAALGVQIVKDVEPYELMKMRLLNGSHSALAYPGYLLGYRRVDQAARDPLIQNFIRRRYMEEAGATLAPAPGMDSASYKDTLISRFANPYVGDTVLRLASEGSSKIPNFMLKPLTEAVKKGLPHESMIFALAAWARFLDGIDEEGAPIPLEDVNGPVLSALAKQAREDPFSFLKAAGLRDLEDTAFGKLAETFAAFLKGIYAQGIQAALRSFSP
jgi:mannitol-1-phosphate/altronate dehydrogenase